MNNEINIAELLKYAPEGMELWSDSWGGVTFEGISERSDGSSVIIVLKGNSEIGFRANGAITEGYDDIPCSLWPSKDHRDWSDFKLPKDHTEFKPLQYVLVPYYHHWRLDQYSHYDNWSGSHVLMSNLSLNENEYSILPYKDNKDLLGKEITDEYRYKD